MNQIAVVINLKWPNLDYPSFCPVGRSTLNVSCGHQTQYCLNGVSATDYEAWPVIKVTRNFRLIETDVKVYVSETRYFIYG